MQPDGGREEKPAPDPHDASILVASRGCPERWADCICRMQTAWEECRRRAACAGQSCPTCTADGIPTTVDVAGGRGTAVFGCIKDQGGQARTVLENAAIGVISPRQDQLGGGGRLK